MKQISLYLALITFVCFIPILVFSLFTSAPLLLVSLVILSLSGYPVFKDTLNVVQGVGFVYWILRDTHKGFSISKGFMRETSVPWRTGVGLQVGLGTYSFQVGVCRKGQYGTEAQGLLKALKGRELHHKPKELGLWK